MQARSAAFVSVLSCGDCRESPDDNVLRIELPAENCTGKERDSESGLDNFGARYDASSMGRIMTPDPLPWLDWQHGNKEERQHFAEFISNPQNLNMYSYVDNNPTSKTDPTGMGDHFGNAWTGVSVNTPVVKP
jgi:RHS repeat-associated protein